MLLHCDKGKMLYCASFNAVMQLAIHVTPLNRGRKLHTYLHDEEQGETRNKAPL